MKASKTLLAGALTLSVASLCSAQTVVHLTGSTAFRSATMTAIEHVMGTYRGAYYTNDGSTSLEGANISIIRGNTTVGDTIVKCFWSGSAGGVQTVDQNIALGNAWMATATLPGSGVQPLGDGTISFDPAAIADVSMSDSLQSSTAFNSTALVDTKVGIVPFRWVANAGSPAGLSNATPNLTQALLTGGMPLSMWTGNPADSGLGVYALGRNADSGTRTITFAECGFGITTLPQQYKPASVVSGVIESIQLYPAETVLGVPYDPGQSGYSSGGLLVAPMKNTADIVNMKFDDGAGHLSALPFGPGYFISYMGRSDANKVTGGHFLTWNGVADSDQAIEEGQYTFWSYEHLMYRPSFTGNQKTVADAIANQIKTVDATAGGLGILLSSMHVQRLADGGLVTHR